jgi:hypothetical protein
MPDGRRTREKGFSRFTPDGTRRIPSHYVPRQDIMQDDTAGPDDRIIPDCDRSDEHAVAADVYTVTDHRAVGCFPTHPNRGALAQNAITAQDRSLMDHESGWMVKSQSWPDRSLVAEVDPHQPDCNQLIDAEIGNPQPPHTLWQAVKFLGDTEEDKDQATVKVA